MLLQTNSYVVPRDKRAEHARVLRRFRQALIRLGCDHFEVFEQVGANWNSADTSGRFVQIMRFRDRKHQMFVQAAERNDPTCQALLREFCELINVSYQQQQGLFAVGFYSSFLRMPPQPQGSASAESSAAHGEAEQGSGHDQADAPTGMLSMAPTEEIPSGEVAIPAADSIPENESDRGQVVEDTFSEDSADAIDLNAELAEAIPDDSTDSGDRHAFSELSESDSPRPESSSRDSAELPPDTNGQPDIDISAELDGDAETENRSRPFNS
jgi:hypothetical protein